MAQDFAPAQGWATVKASRPVHSTDPYPAVVMFIHGVVVATSDTCLGAAVMSIRIDDQDSSENAVIRY